MKPLNLLRSVFLFGFIFVNRIHARRVRASNDPAEHTEPELAVERRILALPEIEVLRTVEETPTNFTGTFHSGYSLLEREDEMVLSLEEEEKYLSWEIAWPSTGRRVEQFVKVRLAPPAGNETTRDDLREEIILKRPKDSDSTEPRAFHAKHRGRRNIFGFDSRYNIPTRSYAKRFPFSTVVKLSTGCTGTLVSPMHVLSAAHCIHDQKDYVTGYDKLSVGVITTPKNAPTTFTWYAVNNSYLPNGWLVGNPDIASKFDYCLLQLKTSLDKPFFKMGISERNINGAWKRIHFTSFEDDKPANTIWYRTCLVAETDAHVLYHRCDALPGSSGSGVYLWDYDADERYWERRLIGVFSGNRWRYYKQRWRKPANFNAAIRLDTAKYTQICQWMGAHADNTCKRKYYIS